MVYFISIPALKSPDEYLIKCTKANIFDRADVLTAFFTYKLLCATVRQRYFCICDKKDVPKMSLHMVIMIYVTKLCKMLSLENLIAYQILRLISIQDILTFNRFKFMINYIISWNDFISYYTSLIETNRMSLPRGVWRRNEVSHNTFLLSPFDI